MKFFTDIIFMTTFFSSAMAYQSTPKQCRLKPQTSSFEFYGDIAPLGYFDPLRVTDNCDEKMLQYMREAEIHHGRIAMVSSVILPVLDALNPDQIAINVLSHAGDNINDAGLFAMAIFETARMTSLYKPPRMRPFELKDDAQPGQLNPYSTLNIKQATKELSNGRLAMIGVSLYILQEFITQQKVFM